MEAELRVNVAGRVAAVRQAEANRRLRWFGRSSTLTVTTSFDPALHRLRHPHPIIHQLQEEEEEEEDLTLTPTAFESVVESIVSTLALK